MRKNYPFQRLCIFYLSGLVWMLCSFTSLAQERSITGTVSSSNGEPIPGVTIQIEGQTKGTVTGIDGTFVITAKEGDVLIFRMVGMKPTRQAVTQASAIQVKMLEDVETLNEVVVTGFQDINEKIFTGATQKVQMEDIKAAGMTDASRMLEGQVAGVTVDNVSGTFGTSPKIRIRSNTSIYGNNQPLWVVDGVILEDLNQVNVNDFISGNSATLTGSSIANINPDDIETYQVLSDASATALYGARAMNGVIVITTKKGKSGKLSISYTGSFSGQLRPTYQQYDLMNSADEMGVYREMYEKGRLDISTGVRAKDYGVMGKMFSLIADHKLPWGFGGGLNEEFLNQYENANTNWFDVLFHNFGLQQQHSINITSGNEKSNSYYSISYLKDQGQTIADKVQRFTATANNTYFLKDWFTFGLKITGSYRDQKAPGTRDRNLDPLSGEFRRDFDINPLSYALNTARSIRPYDENGEVEYFRRNYTDFNILEELEYNHIDINVTDLSLQTNFDVNITKNLTLKSVFQGRYARTKREHIIHERSNQAQAYRANSTQFIQDANNLLYDDPNDSGSNPKVVLPEGGFNYLDENDILYFYNRNSLEWATTLNDIHQINLLAGQEVKYTNRTETSATGIGVVYESGKVVNTSPDIIEYFNQLGVDFYTLTNNRERFMGLFLNGNYSFKNRYVGSFTVRYDGSNQLGKSRNARYLPTWNVGAAWKKVL
jgi:TonB-linked SusC/RagA family outer membrane protein